MLSLEGLLDKDNSFSVHHFNNESLDVEMFQFGNSLVDNIFVDLFGRSHRNYNLCWKSSFIIPSMCIQLEPVKSKQLYKPFIWNITPHETKTLQIFKRVDFYRYSNVKYKKWNLANSPCRLCKIYQIQAS